VGLLEPASTFFLRYKLSSRWDFESETGTKGSGGDLIYTLEK
jgi:translocation and assembly module TamB